jgi:Zn-finger nucleic acid-binding protein
MVKMKRLKDKKTGEDLLLCPRCRINMKKLIKKNVIIDVCTKCGGMWVDAGELEKLAQIAKK